MVKFVVVSSSDVARQDRWDPEFFVAKASVSGDVEALAQGMSEDAAYEKI